ncbi:MAG: coenzyme F420-0:L-glutamate ligase, partial [Candidatus Thorarchaeota archaeon]
MQILEDRDEALRKQSISIMALLGVPIIEHGDDVADAILKALETSKVQLLDGDLITIAHTIVSKSEGRIVHRDEVSISGRARRIAEQNGFDLVQVELALRESKEV